MSRHFRVLLTLLVAVAVAVLLPVAWPGSSGVAYAFHFPWDQGHDTFNPDPGDDDTDPDDDDCNNQGSPFDVATGNYVHTAQDLFIPALGPDLDITRTYNSRDMRSGSFGHGWTFTYDQHITVATDGVTILAICHESTGRRERFTRNPDGSFTPPSDMPATLTANPDGTFTERDKNGTTRTFDAAGRLIAIADRNENKFTFERDDTGFLTRIVDASARRLTFTKGPNGKVQSITDSANRTFSYDYDANGNLTRYVDPMGHGTQYLYDSKHNLTSIVDARGNTVQQMTYDSEERIATYTEQEETWTVSYFPDQKKTTRRDSVGNVWTFITTTATSRMRPTHSVRPRVLCMTPISILRRLRIRTGTP